jgi:creatinine amidohydrolase
MKLFTDLTREQLRELAPQALAVVPLGAVEQHGPHLPVGTDTFAVTHLAQNAARQAAEIPIVVTPTLYLGSSHHHFVFGGTLSLSTETYYRVLCEVIESLVIAGFRRVFLVNGHGGNHELAQLAVRDMALKHPIHAGAGSYWTIAWQALLAAKADEGRRLPGHAGDFETSLMLALRPELMTASLPHRDSFSLGGGPAYRDEHHGFWKEIDGFTDSPDQAKAENGQRFAEVIIGELAKAFVSFYNS